MDALRFNKIAAALLSGVLLIMVFGKIGNLLVSPNTEVSNAYPIEVPEKIETKLKSKYKRPRMVIISWSPCARTGAHGHPGGMSCL